MAPLLDFGRNSKQCGIALLLFSPGICWSGLRMNLRAILLPSGTDRGGCAGTHFAGHLSEGGNLFFGPSLILWKLRPFADDFSARLVFFHLMNLNFRPLAYRCDQDNP
jgi:hypothetical protein